MKTVRIYASIPMSFMYEVECDDVMINQMKEAKGRGRLKEFIDLHPFLDFNGEAVAEFYNNRIEFCDTGAELSEESTKLTDVRIYDEATDSEAEIL